MLNFLLTIFSQRNVKLFHKKGSFRILHFPKTPVEFRTSHSSTLLQLVLSFSSRSSPRRSSDHLLELYQLTAFIPFCTFLLHRIPLSVCEFAVAEGAESPERYAIVQFFHVASLVDKISQNLSCLCLM